MSERDAATGAALAGARFELWRESNGTAGLQTGTPGGDTRLDGVCVTGPAGTCTVELPVGQTYYWRETLTPAGYEPPANPVTRFDLDAGDVTDGIVVTVPNTPQREGYEGSIRIVKQDAKTGRPLRGAVFEVWQETNSTAGLQTLGINPDRRAASGCATDRSGVCDFGPFPEGRYYLLETAVPDGYALPADRVTGLLRLDSTTPDRRLVVTLQNRRDGHGKGDHGKGGHGEDRPEHPERPQHSQDAQGPRT
ncbi:collagen binding domain-containing protein [Streptomyces sp. NPDC058646]|uniref:MSCRAMM family protein n=1 Tax=Streptomyces sp. NPDC058646 TaxID=3346574 RepID=UPI00365BE9D9